VYSVRSSPNICDCRHVRLETSEEEEEEYPSSDAFSDPENTVVGGPYQTKLTKPIRWLWWTI
jgi:hypothetical protein